MNVRVQISKTMETGQPLTVIYHSDTQLGTKRRITPIRFLDQRMLTWCFNAEDYRKFRWRRLEIVPHDYPAPEYVKIVCDQASEGEFSGQISLEEMLGPSIREFDEMGWHVRIRKEAISVHLHRQNGKPRREVVVEISKPATHPRPWCIRSHALPEGRRFYRPQRAAWLLVDQALRQVPVLLRFVLAPSIPWQQSVHPFHPHPITNVIAYSTSSRFCPPFR
jgi:predicted DNA-binding transcriptional regulator YafY